MPALGSSASSCTAIRRATDNYERDVCGSL
jgi:hypothetical protein